MRLSSSSLSFPATGTDTQPKLRLRNAFPSIQFCLNTAVFVLLFLLSFVAARADSVSVTYDVSQLSKTTWQYDYTLSGNFSAGDDLSVIFPYGSSSQLVDESAAGADWTTFVLQPDPLLPADGELDLIANNASPNLQQTFGASFLYTGTDVPGSQNFVLYDSAFNNIGAGTTTQAVPLMAATVTPEPTSIVLLGTAALGMLSLSRRCQQIES